MERGPSGTYALHTCSGDLSIQVGADAVDGWRPADGRSWRRSRRLYAYGLSLADRAEGLEAQAVSTGLLDILLPVRSGRPGAGGAERGGVTRLSERYGVVGVHMFCPSISDAAPTAATSPLYAIPERCHRTSNALTYICPPGLTRPPGEPLCPGGDGQALGDPQPSHGRGDASVQVWPGGARPAV
ncbi:MAG: hypothetical protein ACLS63_03070 [Flavonifractor plautii]